MESNLNDEREVVIDETYKNIPQSSLMFECERQEILSQEKNLYTNFETGLNECSDSYRGYPLESFEDGDPSLLFNHTSNGRISDFPVQMNDVVYEHFNSTRFVENDLKQGSECENWRDRSRPRANFDIFNNKRKYTGLLNNDLPNMRFKNRFNHEMPSRFNANNWKESKLAAKHLKFCPGENCRIYLPLYNFGSNYNMADGLDVYCLECNNRKRLEKQKRRVSVTNNPGKFEEKAYVVTDKFEQYLKDFKYKEKSDAVEEETAEDFEKKCYDAKMREVEKLISTAAFEAEKRFKIKITELDVMEICRKLFMGGRFICEFTNNPVTPQCLLDHHSITFEFRDSISESNGESVRKMDIVCSDSRLSIRKPKHWS